MKTMTALMLAQACCAVGLVLTVAMLVLAHFAHAERAAKCAAAGGIYLRGEGACAREVIKL